MTMTKLADELPSVTVIVAVHNAVARVDSVLSRASELASRPGVDVILIDDCSTDGTTELLTMHQPAKGMRTIVNTKNEGVAQSRNIALAEARGEFIWFVDDDDEWAGEGIDRLRGASRDADLVVGQADYRYGESAAQTRRIEGLDRSDVVDAMTARSMLLDGRVQGFLWTKLIRREVLGANPFPRQKSQSDVVGVARALARSNRVQFVPLTVYTYVRRPGSITRKRSADGGALREAHDHVADALASTATAAELAYFRAWFLCLAEIKTAVRWSTPPGVLRDVVRRSRRNAANISIARVFLRSPLVAVFLLALKTVPGAIPPTLSVLYTALDGVREFRGGMVVALKRLGGFVVLPALALVIPLLVLPAITTSFGAQG